MVELREITQDIFQQSLSLHASVQDRSFVDPVIYSLAEAWLYYENTRPFVIYNDSIMIGFVSMYIGEENYQIINFLIDDVYQRRGFGAKAARLCIEYLHNKYGARRVSVPVKLEHTAAQEFWKKQGFIFSDTIEDGYVFMRRALS